MIKRLINKLKRPNHTWKRFINACLSNIAMSLKSPYVFAFPELITIEPTNVCNLKCPLCPAGTGKMQMRQGFLSLKDFEKIIDEIGDYVYYLVLSNYGEPFLNKDIFEMVSYAKKKEIVVSLATNAQFIDRPSAVNLVNTKLDNILISLDGVNQASYEKYRIGGSFHRVTEAIKFIKEEKNRRNSNLPFISIQFIVMRHNEDEIEEIKKLAKELEVDRLVFKMLMNLINFPSQLKEMEDYIPSNPDYRAYNGKSGSIKWNTYRTDKNFCSMAWNYPAVRWDGDLYPCCFDYNSFDLGNVIESGFKKVWNNKRFIWLRRRILKDKKSFSPCSDCPINFYADMVTDAI